MDRLIASIDACLLNAFLVTRAFISRGDLVNRLYDCYLCDNNFRVV